MTMSPIQLFSVDVMGSHIELDDTLQITPEQGFPKELILEKHLKTI